MVSLSRFSAAFLRPLSRRQMGLLCTSLLLGLALAAAPVRWCAAQQDAGAALRADTLRLHIRAESDAVLDQTRKLMVRDALLALTESLYAPARTQAEALCIAARNLARFQLAACHLLGRLGAAAPVRVSLQNMYFDAADYGSVSLPAGRYDALRVDIGDPERYGRNWWCVLYPGFCLSACAAYDAPAENDLVCGEYILRFRAVDWWQRLTASREDRVLLSVGYALHTPAPPRIPWAIGGVDTLWQTLNTTPFCKAAQTAPMSPSSRSG